MEIRTMYPTTSRSDLLREVGPLIYHSAALCRAFVYSYWECWLIYPAWRDTGRGGLLQTLVGAN